MAYSIFYSESWASHKGRILIVWGVFMLWGFGWDTVGRLLRTEVDGTIITSQDIPNTGAPRYSTKYTIRSVDGKETTFRAGPTDGSLPRSLPAGTQIRKKRWHLDYEENGQLIRFSIFFYGFILSIALGAIVSGFLIERNKNK